jgi:DNA-binding transcriptional LysR family regulator
MAKLDLRRLDMTLLLTLSSLLRTRQVTATANELGLTQSSVSHALARLRDVFDDTLFVRRPFGMEPTPRALELEPIVQAILDLSQQALAPTEFDLADAEGIVRIAALDHHCALVAGPLIERMRHDAPRLKVSFRALARRPAVDAVLAGKIDVGFGLFWNLPDTIERTTLWQDRYCVVGASERWSSHELTMDAYRAGRHLLVSLDGGFDGVIDKALAEIGCERQVVATLPYFLAALAAASEGDGILTIPRGFAERYAERF